MKKIIFALTVLSVAIIGFAFTTSEQNERKTQNWYEYRGPSVQTTSSITDPGNYVLVSSPSGCSSNQKICAVFVEGSDENPDEFDETTESEILQAFNSHQPTTDVLMKQ
ncbi:MAG: hypothetical protein ACO1OO_12940 [Flavisolibacter sp.]